MNISGERKRTGYITIWSEAKLKSILLCFDRGEAETETLCTSIS